MHIIRKTYRLFVARNRRCKDYLLIAFKSNVRSIKGCKNFLSLPPKVIMELSFNSLAVKLEAIQRCYQNKQQLPLIPLTLVLKLLRKCYSKLQGSGYIALTAQQRSEVQQIYYIIHRDIGILKNIRKDLNLFIAQERRNYILENSVPVDTKIEITHLNLIDPSILEAFIDHWRVMIPHYAYYARSCPQDTLLERFNLLELSWQAFIRSGNDRSEWSTLYKARSLKKAYCNGKVSIPKATPLELRYLIERWIAAYDLYPNLQDTAQSFRDPNFVMCSHLKGSPSWRHLPRLAHDKPRIEKDWE